MTAIKKHAIELIMNLPDEEIREILPTFQDVWLKDIYTKAA